MFALNYTAHYSQFTFTMNFQSLDQSTSFPFNGLNYVLSVKFPSKG